MRRVRAALKLVSIVARKKASGLLAAILVASGITPAIGNGLPGGSVNDRIGRIRAAIDRERIEARHAGRVPSDHNEIKLAQWGNWPNWNNWGNWRNWNNWNNWGNWMNL